MNKPNIFLAVLDDVRFDHVSCYGYPRKTTPNIDRLADQGVLFENAFSTSPWSPPSHASIFTGLYPSNHGVLGENLYLNQDIPSVAEIFNSEGYRTLGICPNIFVTPHFGFHRGFNKFFDASSHFERLRENFVDLMLFGLETDLRGLAYRWTYHAVAFRKIKQWITSSLNKNRPFFIFINYFDAHLPHRPPQPFNERFGKIDSQYVDLDKIEDCLNRRFGFPYITKEVEITKEEWTVVKALYDAEISYIDYFLGKVFDYLEKYGILDSTAVLVTSDHGENLGDHQLASHVFCLYDTLLHVPLVIRFPKYPSTKRRISSLVSTVDILPTLLAIPDIQSKVDVDGETLIPFQERKYHKYVFGEYGPPIPQIKTMKRLCPNADSGIYNRGLKCVRSTEFKYIIASDGEEELYDLKSDSMESKNIVKEISENKRKELKSAISQELKGHVPGKKPGISDEIRKRLQELGYF